MKKGHNIDLFDIYSTYIFEKLYTSFPKCVGIEDIGIVVRQIESDHSTDFKRLDIEDDHAEKEIIFSETMLWLTNNGFVDFSSSYPETRRPNVPMAYSRFSCVTLTLKGLNLLTSPKPKSINKHKRLGEELVEKVQEGALKEAGKMLIENMYDYAVRGQ